MAQSTYTDTELLKGLSVNNNDAINEIYRLYQNMLAKWILSRGGDETDAYDVFQDGILVLYEKAKDADFCLTCKLSTYLFAVCKRIWFKKTEAVNHISPLNNSDADDDDQLGNQYTYNDDINLHLEKENNFKLLESSLEQLGHPCSALLKAFYLEDKSMQEIAVDFGYTNSENAKTQKYKCLTRLKRIFFSTKKA